MPKLHAKFIGEAKTSNDIATVSVYECSCGFHIGIDSSYLDQVDTVVIDCPSCKTTLKLD